MGREQGCDVDVAVNGGVNNELEEYHGSRRPRSWSLGTSGNSRAVMLVWLIEGRKMIK